MSNKTILFADDSATMRTIMENTFTAEPFDVIAVPSGEAAINQAKAMKPDVIVVDAGMAGVSGYDVCKAVREAAGIQSTPLVIMSGVSNLYDTTRGESVGVTEHVKKPFDTTQLIQLVTELADRPREDVEEAAGVEEEIEVVADGDASLETLSEPPLETISVVPDDLEDGDDDYAQTEMYSLKSLEASDGVVSAPEPEPIALTKPVVHSAPSMSAIALDGGEKKVGTQTLKFGGRQPEEKVASETDKPKMEVGAAGEESDFGEVALGVNDADKAPETPDVAPIEIESGRSDVPAESFQVGTLAELAQMDGQARPISPESSEHAIELKNAAAKAAAVPSQPEYTVATTSPSTAAPMDDIMQAARTRISNAAKNVVEQVEGITVEQAEAIQTLTREVIERVVWEVVPDLAEVIIKEELKKLLEE